MSGHARPEYIAPDDQRCGALVPGHKSWHWEWARHDHQCPKTAQQMRGPIPVCHIHARAKEVTPWSPTGRLSPRSSPNMQCIQVRTPEGAIIRQSLMEKKI